MISLAEALTALDARPHLIPAAEWPESPADLDRPGLYAWWLDESGAKALSVGAGITVPAGRIYVGQAGAASTIARSPSAATLHSRIGGNHLSGKVRSSTFRLTLASLLLAPLALALEGRKRLSDESEARLSAWMLAHLSIAAYVVDSGEHLAALEEDVVTVLKPPLDIEHMPPSELRARVQHLRAIVAHGLEDLWLAPDPVLTDWRSILGEYGQAFDGYRYAKLVRRRECAEVADEVWRRFEEEGRFASTFADMRCALFWLQRCVHNNEQACDWGPSAELEAGVRSLYGAIQETWQSEWGAAR